MRREGRGPTGRGCPGGKSSGLGGSRCGFRLFRCFGSGGGSWDDRSVGQRYGVGDRGGGWGRDGGNGFGELVLNIALVGLTVAIEDTQNEGDGHKDSAEPDGSFGEDVGGLSAENRIGEVATKGGAETFRAWLLHKDKEGEEDANQKVHPEESIND